MAGRLNRALRDLPPPEQVDWRRAFAGTRGGWAAAYSRLPRQANTRPALFLPPDRESERRYEVAA